MQNRVIIIMREFILLALKARTSADFDLNNLPDAGRMDLVCRVVSNALFISNAIRQDTVVHVCMTGPKDPPKTISFIGAELKGFLFDERSIAAKIKEALNNGAGLKLNEEKKLGDGIKISKRSFESIIREKSSDSRLIFLHSDGADIRKITFEPKKNVVFILGDFIGLPRNTERLLNRFNAQKIKLGPIMLFASHCPIIIHNELDRAEFS